MHESAADGHAVLTQSCDLAPRPGRDRPFVAVAPLVQLDGDQIEQAARGRLTRFAHVPTYLDGAYCADLDRITTIETGVLLLCDRLSRLDTDQQRLEFSRAVARKFERFAYPDDLANSIRKWRDHVISKHGRQNSQEGELYRSALEVLVSAEPSWDAERIQATITVLVPPGVLPLIDPDAEPEVGEVEAANRLSAAEIAGKLLNGEIDMRLGAVMCNRLQDEWAKKCDPTGVIETVQFTDPTHQFDAAAREIGSAIRASTTVLLLRRRHPEAAPICHLGSAGRPFRHDEMDGIKVVDHPTAA